MAKKKKFVVNYKVPTQKERRAAKAARKKETAKEEKKFKKTTEVVPRVRKPKRQVKPGLDKNRLVKPLAEQTPKQRSTAIYREEEEAQSKEGARPAPVLTDVDIDSKRPSTAGLRAPKKGELKRGKTSVRLRGKKVQEPKTKVDSPYRKPPSVRRNPVTGKAESISAVKEGAKVTSLPEAGPAEMTEPTPGPRVPLDIQKGGIKQALWKDDKGVTRRLKGFAVPAEHVSKKAWEAMGHLDSMRLHQVGSTEHNKHTINFSNAHEEVRSMSSDVHTILGMAYKVASQPKYAEQDKHLNLIKDALSERISIGRAMEKRREESQQRSQGK